MAKITMEIGTGDTVQLTPLDGAQLVVAGSHSGLTVEAVQTIPPVEPPPVEPPPVEPPPVQQITTKPLSSVALFPRPDAGFGLWRGTTYTFPSSAVGQPNHAYDRYSLSDVEKSKNVYDWTLIDKYVVSNASKGLRTKLGFRMQRKGDPNPCVPPYLVDNCKIKDGAYWPNPEDPEVIDAVERFAKAINTKYGNDWRVFGLTMTTPTRMNEGNFASRDSPFRATPEAIQDRYLAAWVEVSKTACFRVLAMTDGIYIAKRVLTEYPRIGLERHSVGWASSEIDYKAKLTAGEWKLLQIRGRTAPVYAEPGQSTHRDAPPDEYAGYLCGQIERMCYTVIGNGNYYLQWGDFSADTQRDVTETTMRCGYRLGVTIVEIKRHQDVYVITSDWSNTGTGNVLDEWKLRWHLGDRSVLSSLDVRAVGSAPLRVVDTIQAAPTQKELRFRFEHHAIQSAIPKLPALGVAIEGRQSDGSYTLGLV